MRKILMFTAILLTSFAAAGCDGPEAFPQPEATQTGTPVKRKICNLHMVERNINGCGDDVYGTGGIRH